MKHLMMLCVAGILLAPAVGRSDNFIQPVSGTMGTDRMASENTAVYAISRGYAYYYKSNAESFGGCNVNGVALWIKHRKASGQYFWALYGHIKNSIVIVEARVVAVAISPGQRIADIADYYPCYNLNGTCGTSHCPHLHFGIWDSQTAPCGEPGSVRCKEWGYAANLGQDSFVNANTFLTDEHPYPEGPTYVAHLLGQNESVTPWMAPNTSRMMWVDYRNDGTATWTSTVELRSMTGSDPCVLTTGCAYDPADWITQQRITVANQAAVAAGSKARFQFQAKAAGSTGSCVQWVAPWAPGGTCMEGWGGANFTVRTDATPPTSFTASVTPWINNTNSFSFSWTASSDAHSGLYGYYWHVNENGESFTTSTSVAAGAWATVQGTNTLYVRAVDIAGNSTSATPVTFANR